MSGLCDSTRGGAGEAEASPLVRLCPHLAGRGPDSHTGPLGTGMPDLNQSLSPSQSGPPLRHELKGRNVPRLACCGHLKLGQRRSWRAWAGGSMKLDGTPPPTTPAVHPAPEMAYTNRNPGLPRWLNGKEPTCQCSRHGHDPSVGMIPWRGKWQPAAVFLNGKSHRQGSLVGYSPWGCS